MTKKLLYVKPDLKTSGNRVLFYFEGTSAGRETYEWCFEGSVPDREVPEKSSGIAE